MADRKEVKEFYDAYVDHQEMIGINSRHIHILDKLKQAGLKKNHRVLEVGCGIGIVSHLIAKKVPSGHVLAVDISERSIDTAKKLWKLYSNLSFEVSDMQDFLKPNTQFDFFVFPDVLEHIPVDQHPHLFKTIDKHSHDGSVVCIHIPAPRFLEYNIQHDREKLQVIDQPLDTGELVINLKNAGYFLEKMETYPVFYKEKDYQFFVFKRNIPLRSVRLRSKWPVLWERLKLKWRNGLRLWS